MNYTLNDIVISGFSAVTAAGIGLEPVLELIRSGRDALTQLPAEHAVNSSGYWGKAAGFKATDFIPPLKARKLDRCSQFAVAVAGLALKNAGIDRNTLPPERIGIALGCGFGGVANSAEFLTGYFVDGVEGISPMLFPNTVSNASASNVSIEHGLKGPNVTQVQRFCSAESAFMMACSFIIDGRADIMLTGGVDDLTPLMLSGFAATGQLQRYARAFGEGCGMLVLESAGHAERRGGIVKGRVDSISTVGRLVPGHENMGIDLLMDGFDTPELVSLSGTATLLPPLTERFSGITSIDAGRAIGSSLAMGGTAMAALLASLKPGQPGLHLAASPEGPYFAIRFQGGTSV
ncbi:MAG: beta-ketoacyl synthase N-terminal-like domain-containing protein [Desulfuromonadaceae bacterium]|nr:beta-ketoacyl synthase N-terminal-like domain-containing protein [Desulfuromonadaceae bacterium]